MKNTVAIISILVLFSSCENVLDTKPTDFLTQASYWQTERHAMEAVTGCYQALTHDDLYNNQTPFMFEVMSPNAYHKDNYQNANDFATGTQTATTVGMNLVIWTGSYRGIGRCNTLIDNIGKIEMDETLRNRLIGEAKFLRAFYYQMLNELFNGVPLIMNQPNISEHSRLPRNSYDEVLAQVLKDLDEAAAALPVKYTSVSDGGRATAGAALSLKARVLLQNHRYQEVVSTLKTVIDSGVYGLFENYNGLFKKANEGNKEIVFDVRFKYPEIPNMYDIVHGQYNTQTPTQELVDQYQMTDGKSILESQLYDSKTPYKNRDPRFEQSIVYLGAQWRNKPATTAELHQTGYAFKKFTEYTGTTVGEITNPQCNYVVIRYADVLLMYAEALNEIGGPDARVYDAVNAVRQRPSVNMPKLAGLNKESMQTAIRLERRIEFAGEGIYFYDIRRWKTIEKEMNGDVHRYDGQFMQRRKFNPARDYFWPIPFTQIDLNSALKQNSNY